MGLEFIFILSKMWFGLGSRFELALELRLELGLILGLGSGLGLR